MMIFTAKKGCGEYILNNVYKILNLVPDSEELSSNCQPYFLPKEKRRKKKRPNNLNLPEKLELLRFGDIYLFVDMYYMLFLTLWRINIQD